jgi:hypothetical protein
MICAVYKCYPQSTVSSPYKIESIKAFLYYNQNNTLKDKNVAGTYSPNILDKDSFSLWNVIIGEGDALGCSGQTMIVVEISGNPKEYTRRQLSFNAVSEGKVLLSKKFEFAILDENDKYYASYLLYDTGCSKVKLSAEIIGKKVESKMEKIINFECGE